MPATQTDRIDGISTSVAVKAPCRCATTAAITLSGLQTIDGVVLAADDRVLVMDQADAEENGIYVAATTAWARARDFDGSRDAVLGTFVYVTSGDVNSDTTWRVVATDNPIVFDTSDITFAQGGLGGATGGAGVAPGGRLTLAQFNSQVVPVSWQADTDTGTVFYIAHAHNIVPVWNGSRMAGNAIPDDISGGSGTLAAILDATNHTSGHLYDVFAISSTGSLAIGYGPAWTSSTGRGTGAGTTELGIKKGLWTNANVLAHLYNNGIDLGPVAVNQGTYLGTVHTTGNGLTAMQVNRAVVGGGNNQLGVWNAYNRERTSVYCRDGTTSWTYATATWRPADNDAGGAGSNTACRISWIDGLMESNIRAHLVEAPSAAGGTTAKIGINLDSTSATPEVIAQSASAGADTIAISTQFPPQIGLHYLQAMELATGATVTFRGNPLFEMGIELEM